MDATILQDVGPIERRTLLRDSATKTEVFTYPKPLDGKEITHLKDLYTKDAIEMAKHVERKKEFMEAWKSEVKPLTLELGQKMTKIRSRVEEITEDVYLLPDHETSIMLYYNGAGVLVYHRPLMPEENQFSVVDRSFLKNASNS